MPVPQPGNQINRQHYEQDDINAGNYRPRLLFFFSLCRHAALVHPADEVKQQVQEVEQQQGDHQHDERQAVDGNFVDIAQHRTRKDHASHESDHDRREDAKDRDVILLHVGGFLAQLFDFLASLAVLLLHTVGNFLRVVDAGNVQVHVIVELFQAMTKVFRYMAALLFHPAHARRVQRLDVLLQSRQLRSIIRVDARDDPEDARIQVTKIRFVDVLQSEDVLF